MWHLKTTDVAIIIRTLGMIKKGADKHIYKIPGNPCIQEIKKIAFY